MRRNGQYSLLYAGGNETTFDVVDIPEPLLVSGSWEVSFNPEWGAPETTTFEMLTDWTHSPDPGIRYYSGKAAYSREIELPEVMFRENQRLILDLGEVGNIAHVMVNGTDLGRDWHFPMEIDITGAAKPGSNRLEIDVTGTWNNRLVGDARYPEQAKTWLATDLLLTGDEGLVPSGLIGPVKVYVEKTVNP